MPCLLLAMAGAGAQPDDPLKAPACAQALQALAAAREKDETRTVASARQAAARICLGAAGAPARPARLAQPPLAVPAPRLAPLPSAASVPPLTPAPPAVAIDRPGFITHCDAAGCWRDDGTRLQRIAPTWPGAHGPCGAPGGFGHCP
jgi:hypothetical protein